MKKTAIIIGAGPAGLTAAYELLTRTDIIPLVLEQSGEIGGLSRTIQYKGNRIDIGGHRFFSKSDRVMQWWHEMLPAQGGLGTRQQITYQNKTRALTLETDGPDPEREDHVMLIRSRKSRIYFLRRFFDYPISLSRDTLAKLGVLRTVRIGLSYLHSALFPGPKPTNLEQFFISRFGAELYQLFFKSYTEKVWGLPCDQISAEWGAQRIKGLSIGKALLDFFRKKLPGRSDLAQKNVETSLIEQFLYPKHGPGQMWEEVARRVEALGGRVLTGVDVRGLRVEGGRATAVETVRNGTEEVFAGDYFFSTMPIKELVRALRTETPPEIAAISEGLVYRDFITVGMLLDTLKITESGGGLIKDNWLYIQEPDVQVGRVQIFNNWSPALVADPDSVWIGLEYFCYDTDEIWFKTDAEMISLATEELDRIGIIEKTSVRDATVIRVPKTYPAYFGSYDQFPALRAHLDGYENLFLVGRNGMHKYNNQDHSMLTAMVAVDNILAGRMDKSNIWDVNAEQEYHETRPEGNGETLRGRRQPGSDGERAAA